MRDIVYSCDQCKKNFDRSSHLNVKPSSIYLSYIDPDKSRWYQKCASTSELHFCNTGCLVDFLIKKLEIK